MLSQSMRHNLNPSCVMYSRSNSKSLHLQAQVTLARGWCQKSRDCAKSHARRSACFCNQSGGGASICLLT